MVEAIACGVVVRVRWAMTVISTIINDTSVCVELLDNEVDGGCEDR
jgi:hypothetical protein